MNSFEYYNPVKVVFGKGERERIGNIAKELGKRVCVVSYKKNDFLISLLQRVNEILDNNNLDVVTFYEIEENPEVKTLEKGVELCKVNNVELLIGIGGGSVMDATKVLAAGVYYERQIWDMVCSRHDQSVAVPPVKALPTIMLPTLPATGSEMNMCAVVSNCDLREKSYLWAPCLYPKISIIDPELTVSLPPYQTACAAADSISHVLEIYLNGEEDSDLQHYFQEGVMRTVIDNVGKVLTNPNDISARSHLQWAATCAINGWASPGDAWTPIHQVGHVLTSLYKIPHGASLSILMPAWMEYMYERRKKQYFRFAKNVMQIETAGKSEDEVILLGIQHFKEFLAGIGAPVSLKDVGVENTDVDAIVKGVVKVSFNKDGYLTCQPQPVSADDIKNVLFKVV